MDLNEARKRLPELAGLSDESALNVIHQVYYPKMDRAALADRLGFKAAPPPVPERSMARAAGDLGLQFAGGAVSGVRMMSDLFGADNAVSGGLRGAEDALRELQSAAAKADQQRIAEIMKEAESKGFGDQVIAGVKAFGQAPAAMIAQALGTSVPTLATALIPGVGQGAMAARLAAGAGVGAAQGAGNIKGVIYEEIKNNPLPGETPEQTEFRAIRAQEYGGQNTGQIALGGGLGALAGTTGMERALSGLRNGVTQAAPGMVARVGMGAAAEAVPEIAQGGQEKLAGNLALRNEGFDVDPMAGVVAGATMEGLAGGLTGGVTAIPRPAVIGEREPVPAPVPPVEPPGPMTKAVNALGPRLTTTPTADLLGRNTDPLAGQMTADRLAAEDAAVTRQNFADRNGAMLAGGGLDGSRADPLANMLADSRTSEANSFTNVQQAANRRPPMPASDAARILDEAKNRGMDLTAAPHPDGGFVVVPRQWVTPDVAAQAETEIADTLARMQQADAAPVERAERRRSEPVDLNLNTDPVAGYIEDLRNTNTPAARAYVGEFDAGRVTRADVEQRMQADRGKTADERLAEAAAEGLKLNPKGDPFKTLMAANLAAKTTPGTVIEVPGGYAIRPQESTLANTAAQEVPEADAAPVQADEPAAAVSFADAADEAGGAAVRGSDEPGAVQALKPELADIQQDVMRGNAVTRLTKEEYDAIKAEQSNVQDAPQAANDTAAETPAVEAPAPARGDGAAAAGVPDAGAGAGVRADGVKLKDGARITLSEQPAPKAFSSLVRNQFGEPKALIATNDAGEEVGRLTFMPNGGPIDSFVREQDRRRGVGTALYDAMEARGGKLPPIDSGVAISDDARAFRSARDKASKPGATDVQADGVKKPPFAKKEDVEHLFGIDQKRKAALDRIAKGTAYFGTQEKAADFVAKSGIKDTHEVVQAKPGRFEIRAKAGSGMQTADAAPTEQAAPREPALERRKRLIAERKKADKPMADMEAIKENVRKADAAAAERVRQDFKDADQIKGNVVVKDGMVYRLNFRPKHANGRPNVPDGMVFMEFKGSGYVLALEDGIRLDAPAAETRMRNARETNHQVVNEKNIPYSAPSTKGPGEQLAELNAELERQGPVQNANTRAKRDQIRREIAERDFPEILKAVDGDIDTAEDLNRAFQYAGDEPKAKTVERILKKRGITPEYQKVWTGRLVPQEAAPAKPAPTANTIFTEDAAAAARALLKKKLSGGTLNSGIDPEILQAGITLAGYHIEKGARTFSAYAKAMVGDLGDSVKPYLKSWYAAVALDPRATGFSGDMTPLGDVMTADVDKLAAQADTVEDQNRDDNATRPLDRPGQGALEGAPAADVQGTAEAGPAGRAPAGSRGGDQPGDAGADGAGVRAPRGMGSDPAAVPVPAGRARSQRGSAGKRGAAPDARDEREPSLFGDDGAGDSRGEAGRVEPPAFQPTDFTIEEDFALGEGGQKAKYRANVDAIRLLQKLEAEQRHATPDEQKVLAKYVGWGGVSQAFDAEHKDWGREFAELRELLSDEEYNTARRSTRYAHYTSRPIIQGMYDAMKRFGFTGGKMLEPGAGVGNFMGLMPADLRSGSRLTGVERERIAAGIARHLYPNQNMQLQDFTQFNAQDGYFDAVIGNPPFAKDPLTDSSGRKHLSGMAVHDYFFAKSVDMLRDGGVFAAVVSNGFMDKAGDRARKYIGERTKLLGAIRLPNNAFAKNANTEVTTDIVFLQKLPEAEWGSKAAKADLKRWLDVTTIPDPKGGDPIKINQYFADNPQMMLGEYGRFGTMYGPDQPALVARPGQDTAALLRAAIERLPAGVYQHAAVTGTNKATRDVIEALRDKSVQEGGFYVDGGKLYQRMQDVAGESSARLLTPETQWTEKTTLGESRHERLVQLAGMRRTLRDLLAAELADDKGMEALRKSLNEQYDAYAAKHGLINDPSTAQVFDDDPDFPLLAALEMNYARGMGPAAAKAAGIKPYKSKADKAPIFARRVIEKRQAVQKAETPEDALNVSIAERGRIDAGYIGQLLGRPADEVLEELTKGDKPALFVDPVTGEHVLRDAYLSGNVRKKLQQAEMAGMDRNVRALMEVQPEDVGAHEISARIGSPWVPVEVYQDFIKSLLGDGTKATVAYVPTNSAFFISVKAGSDTANNLTYGTSKMDAEAILNALLNNRTVKVTYTDSDGKTHLDKEGTDAAMEKAADIRAKFQDWIFADAERAEVLVRAYNDTNNNYVTRVYDGARMEFPGKVPDSIIKFRRHQRNAIARIVQDRTALLDHVVGAGKTFTVISGAMELKRTGLAKKPLIVVPNHLVKQWAADFYRLYPGANILTATKKDFARENRRRFLAKIATGDWDAVIMAHSSFGFIQPDPDFEVEFNEKQVAHIKAAIEKVDASDGDEKGKKRTVKQLEGLVERLENRIKSLRDKAVDNLLDFKQVGVDQLFVDEAHLFKNLMFSTKMQNVQGLGDSKGSQRAYDMYVKVNQLYAQNGRGQGVVFATGTPVSNTLAEMYHMMRYLMPAAMDEAGFQSFDAWANTFASVEQVWMQKPSGDGYKASDRMGTFSNVHELLKMFDQVSDTVTMEDIKTAYAEENGGKAFPLPKLKNDRRTPVSLVKSEAQNAYMDEIAERAKKLEAKKGPPQKGEDNFLTIMSDARKAAMDVRLVREDINDREPGARIDRSTDEVVSRYKQYDSVKGTQLVFSDLGTPLKSAKKELKEYEELKARIDAGNDADVQADAALGDEAAQAKIEDAEAAQEELDAKGRDWLGAIKAALRGFSVYDDFKAALIEKGIPENEIAFIHDFNTDDQKAALFRKVNAGQIRVLLGSTQKMGAGTNVQERLVALHHLDVPWKPSDIEQREGRIVRQGNRLADTIPGFEVEILAYVTQDTLDMRMWQTQEVKLKMVNQLRTRQISREIENPFEEAEMSAGEMQAAATGNMDLLREIQLRSDLKKLEQRKRSFDAQRNELASRRKRATDSLRRLPEQIADLEVLDKGARDYFTGLEDRPFKATINGDTYTSRAEAGAKLRELAAAHEAALEARRKAGDDAGKAAADAREDLSPAERTGIAMDAKDAYLKANPLPKMAVEFNGKTYGSKSALADAMTEFAGDSEPIEWSFDGQEFIRRKDIAAAIEAVVTEAIDTDTEASIGSIGGFKVTIEGQRDKFGSFVDMVVTHKGKTYDSTARINGDDKKQAADIVVRAAERMVASLPDKLQFSKYDLARAKKAMQELEKTSMPDTWPDMGKLEKARAEHKEVLKRLAGEGKKEGEEGGADTTLSIDDGTGPADTADHGPATRIELTDEQRAAVARLQSVIRRKEGNAGYVLEPVEQVAGAGREFAFARDIIRDAFGIEVTPVKQPGKRIFNGAQVGDQLLLDVNTQKPAMAVMGHELLHQLRRDDPQLYSFLKIQMERVLKDGAADTYAKKLRARYEALGLDALNDDTVMEELLADIVGDQFGQRGFWDILAKKNFRRMVNLARKVLAFFDKVLATGRETFPFETDQYLADIEAAREIVADVLAEYSGDKVGRGGDGDVKLSAAENQDQTETAAFKRWFSPSPRDVVAGLPESVVNGLETHAKAIANFLESEAVTSHRGGLINIPRPVLLHMVEMVSNNKILDAIVGAIPVDVVNFLGRKKLSAKDALHDVTVLKNVLSVDPESDVSLGVDPSSLPLLTVRVVANAAAKIAGLTGGPFKRNAAILADANDPVLGAHVRKSVNKDLSILRGFGESKVVDASGKPLVVYHGTPAGGFSEFSPAEKGKRTMHSADDVGYHFTSDPSYAEAYSEGYKLESIEVYRRMFGDEPAGTKMPAGASTYPVYLSLKNPLIVGASKQINKALIEQAIASGHDGIVADMGGAREYVAFRPTQIKSAIGNAGTFDPDNADIRFSVADDIKKAIPAFDVKTAPKNSWAHYRGMAMQALGRRQIVDLYAEELPQLAQYDYLVQQMDAEKNDSGAEADKLAQDWGKLRDEKQLAELMHDATLAQIDPARPMETGVLQAQYRELKARFDALTPEAQALYRQARDMYDGHYRKVQKAIKERIERSEMSAGQKRQIMAKMDEELFKKLKGVYFPLARFGQYVIVVKDANGEVKNVTRAETVGEAEEARKELHKVFPKHMGYTVGKVLKQAEFNAGRDAVGKGFMADLMDALDAKGIDDELRDTVAQLYLSSLPDLSWAKHGIHRKGTPGFSQDARRAFAQNMFHGARYLAKLRYADQLQDELISMQDHVKAYEGVEEYDSIQAQQVVDEMVKRHEIMMNPKTSGVSTALTSLGFVFHLGLSPASAMVNLSQTALVAYPMMGAKWGWGKASAALLAASQDVVKAKNDLGTILKGAELDAYERAVKDGTIDVTMAHDLAGISQGEDQKVFWKIRPVMRAASFMFHHAERFNRQATFIAAWRMAKEAGPDKTADQLYEEAKKLTYDSHFDYSASNRPRVMQGNWQRVIFLFKQYAQAMVYTLSRNAYLSMKGLTPADRALARKNLGGILATHAAAAGVLGLPLVGPLLTAASFIGSDDDEPWDAEVAMQNVMADMVGPKAAEVMARGFSRLTPFDLSGRVALNKLILPDVQEGLEGKQWAESAMAAALGPVAGIGVNMARGFQKITDGHYMMGLEDMMPTALRAPLRAMRYASEGAVDKTGVVITDEVGPGSIAGQALGFSPSEVRRATERKAAIMDYDRSLADRRSSLVRQWAEAQMAGDTDGVKDVMAEIQGFNQKNPNRKITMPNLIQSVRARRRRIEQAEDGVYLPKNREGAREAVRF